MLLVFYYSIVTTQAQSEQYITIDKNIFFVDNLNVVDSVGANNRIEHKAYFDISLNNDERVVGIINELEQSMNLNKQLNIVFTYASNVGRVGGSNKSEVITYSKAIVKRITIDDLNAAGNEPVKIHITIDGGLFKSVSQLDTDIRLGKSSGTFYRAVESNFRLILDTLNSSGIVKISGFEKNYGSMARNVFQIELIASTKKGWNDLFDNGSGKIIREGKIEILTPNLKDVIFTIYLNNVTIISYRSETKTNSQRSLDKVNYTLMASSMSFNKQNK